MNKAPETKEKLIRISIQKVDGKWKHEIMSDYTKSKTAGILRNLAFDLDKAKKKRAIFMRYKNAKI